MLLNKASMAKNESNVATEKIWIDIAGLNNVIFV